ncbi:MAG: hypothetical protein IT238_00965 [Bacteroidia bacterium]|nr:hypothetical protein [Bacteroidia bacterium]MCZ2248923.1 hypothetical protein [Bacteroidia bacterium]
MNKKRFYLLFFMVIVFCHTQAFSQKQIIHHNLKQDTLKTNKGPNARKFSYSYLNFGGIIPDSKVIHPQRSHEIGFGRVFKRRINNVFSLGNDLAFLYRNYNIKDTANYAFPPGAKLKQERIYTRNLQLKPWLRINYGKRGNTLGKFIDIGAYGEWSFARTHYYKFENPKGTPEGVKAEYILRKHDWFLPFNYGAMVRLGFNKWGIYGTYRLSNMFKTNRYFIELPRISAGISYAIF